MFIMNATTNYKFKQFMVGKEYPDTALSKEVLERWQSRGLIRIVTKNEAVAEVPVKKKAGRKKKDDNSAV